MEKVSGENELVQEGLTLGVLSVIKMQGKSWKC